MYRANAYDKDDHYRKTLAMALDALRDLSPYVSSNNGGQGMRVLDIVAQKVTAALDAMPRDPLSVGELYTVSRAATAEALDALGRSRAQLKAAEETSGVWRQRYNEAVWRIATKRWTLLGAATSGFVVGTLFGFVLGWAP